MDRKLNLLAATVMIVSVSALPAYAAGTTSGSWEESVPPESRQETVSLYDQGVQAHKNGDYQKALYLFNQALTKDYGNPDILNMIAHCQLKLGMIDEALETYKKAIALRPKFPEAREYLGEAYIQALQREINTLKSYGSDGAENLEDLTKALKQAAASVE